nr:MAG TPA: tail protein [Caudoviricetes sp.]
MLTFYDEKGNGYGAQVEFTTKNAVNGERSVSGTILTNEKVLSRIDRGWSFEWDGEMYKIIYAKPKDEGRSLSVSFDAVHQFFYDFDHSNCYKEFNGSNRFEVYIEEIFKDSGYRYVIEAQAGAIRKENFGNASRLKMFKDIIKAAGLEFSVTGKVVRILKKVGTDLSTVVRKNFNMNELTLEKNIGAFITYKKGLGAWKDENNHGAGRYTSEYESPLARIYGRIEGEPVTDERYKETGKLLERLKKEVDESYSISVQLEMEDLTRAGYKYKQPRAGDYIMAINETIGFREKIRIVSYESSYDVTGRLIKHKVTCNDIGTVQKAITSEGSIMRSVSESREYAEGALEVATRALVSANGKNTNYYGAKKPEDNPRGTLHEGDLLYLTVGEETELYYWSGTEWLPKILKVDTAKIEKIVNNAQTSTNQAIAQANAKAEEALKKAGTLPDTSKLSDQIKQQILSSPDLSRKVAENLEQTDSGVIYNKIYQNIQKQFVPKSIGDFLMGEHDRMRDYQSYLDSKIERQTIEFNKLTESNKLYERIIGTSETGAPDKLSRLVMSSDIFQTEVGKYVTDDNNLIVNSMSMSTNTLVNANRNGVEVTLNDGVFSIKAQGLTGYNFTGFSLPIYVKKIYRGETYTLGFKYRFKEYPDHAFAFNVKNHKLNKILLNDDIGKNRPPLNEWQEFQQTFTVREDFLFGEDRNFPFYIYLVKNGWVEFKEPILVRGSRTGPYKPSQFDDAYKSSDEAKELASNAQAKAIQIAQGVEAVRTQVTQLNNSWSVRNLNSAGDVLGQLNLNPDGSIRINEGLLSIGEKTYIKDGVIKKSMIGNAQIDTAHIKEIDASKANIFNLNVNNINGLNAEFIKAKIEYALVDWMRGKKISAVNDKMVIDLNEGTINLFSNTGTIRRIDDTRSSQFLKMTRSGFIAEHFRDPNSAMIVLGTNHDKTENTSNETFAGTRLWSGSGNGVNESFYELVADRIAFYSNGKYRSPWLIHNNTEDGNTYLIPMNEKGVKHNLGRGDKHFSKTYTDTLYLGKEARDLGFYLWDIITCFGIIARYGWDLKNSSVQSHVRSVFTKYGFK